MRGKDWWWYHPAIDVLVGIRDGLGVLVAIVQRRKYKVGDVPKPMVRPWEKEKHVKKMGNHPRPIKELRKLLGWDQE